MAEVLSSEAIKAKPSEADDDTVEVEEKSNEPAKADEPEHVEDAGTATDDHAGSGWVDDHDSSGWGEKRKGGGRHGLEPKLIAALVNCYRWHAMPQSRSYADRLHQSMEKLYCSRDNVQKQVDAALCR